MFDLRKGVADVENLKTWLASIRSHAQHCPVIVVGTHMDKLPKGDKFIVPSKHMWKSMGFFDEGKGVTVLFKSLPNDKILD